MKKRLILLSCLLGTSLFLVGCGSGSKNPDVTLSDYTSVSVDRIISTVTDEAVQDEIDAELSSNADYNDITDRAAQIGDMVTVDYVGYIDGETFDGGSETDAEITLGSQEYIEGFEEGIVGMELDETKEVSITFSDDYVEEVAGKEAVFEVTLKRITEVTDPELTDEYVAEYTSYSSVDEYKAALKDQLQMTYDEDATSMANYEALAKVVEDSEVSSYPEDMLKEAISDIEESNASFAEMFGMDISELYGEDYDPEEDAKDVLKERLVVNAIADKENLSVSDEEYEDYIGSIWEEYGYESLEDFETDYPKEDTVYDMLYEMVVAKIGEYVTYNDISEEEYYGTDDEELLEEDVEAIEELNDELALDEELLDALALDDLEEDVEE